MIVFINNQNLFYTRLNLHFLQTAKNINYYRRLILLTEEMFNASNFNLVTNNFTMHKLKYSLNMKTQTIICKKYLGLNSKKTDISKKFYYEKNIIMQNFDLITNNFY